MGRDFTRITRNPVTCHFTRSLFLPTIPADLVRRHAGVLGLSACILSSPYDVPTWMPQLLMDLSAHLNDTQPIEVRLPAAHLLIACSRLLL